MTAKHAEESSEDRIDIGAAARILGVHTQTVRYWESKGWITATRTPGGYRRFRRGDVIELRDNPPKLYERTPADEAVAEPVAS